MLSRSVRNKQTALNVFINYKESKKSPNLKTSKTVYASVIIIKKKSSKTPIVSITHQ